MNYFTNYSDFYGYNRNYDFIKFFFRKNSVCIYRDIYTFGSVCTLIFKSKFSKVLDQNRSYSISKLWIQIMLQLLD